MKRIFFLLLVVVATHCYGQVSTKVQTKIFTEAQQLETKVIEWRRHIHQYPELSNREFKTAEYVEKHLRALGLEVKTGVAHTGVV